MKQLIARLREICLAGWWDDEDVAAVVDSLPQLLDRLEALERMVETGQQLAESAITHADILKDGTIIHTRCAVCPEKFSEFQDALAALQEDK